MKKLLYALVGASLVAQNNLAMGASLDFGRDKIVGLSGSTEEVDSAIVTLITTLASFAGLIAVLYAIFGGFTILTAAGDEEKVKKGRTIIFHAILGLIVIFLAFSIISWILTVLGL